MESKYSQNATFSYNIKYFNIVINQRIRIRRDTKINTKLQHKLYNYLP